MCKYKHSLTKIETSCIVALLNGTNCRFVDYVQILKMWTLYFHSCPAVGNSRSFSVTQKVHDFQDRK